MPITNDFLYEEARFLRVLPSDERFSAPEGILLAPAGDAEILASAKRAASDWDSWWSVAVAAGDRLRETEADEETDISRSWRAVSVATRKAAPTMGLPEGTLELWAQCDIVLADDDTSSFTLSVAPSEDGPWTGVGEGSDIGGSGETTWDLSATARALGGEPPSPLGVASASYTDAWIAEDGLRAVEASISPLPETAYSFSLSGEVLFGFVGTVSLTEDGLSWPTQAAVYHEEGGGRAEGVVVVGEALEQLSFRSCWDKDGHLVWQTGDDGVTKKGAESDCPVALP